MRKLESFFRGSVSGLFFSENRNKHSAKNRFEFDKLSKFKLNRLLSLGLLVFSGLQTVQAQTIHPQATVETGVLQGIQNDGIISFKGIPFAAPPVGELRWRAPQPAAKWTGIRNASAFGHDCMQIDFPNSIAPDAPLLETTPSEDCLYANVWRPATKAKKLPVLVWIYGGGFVNGGSSSAIYSGEKLAKEGILFFSFNYRLGRFGIFAHPQLSAENKKSEPLVNFNHMDQIAALRWVQKNIASFGGDPTNVTIVGESAGGRSIHTLITSPDTKGLFARAVVQSGGGGDNISQSSTLAAIEKMGLTFAESKGIKPNDPNALSKLRALSPEQVVDGLNLAAYFTPGAQYLLKTFGRVVPDGKVAVDSLNAYQKGVVRPVPLMVGANSNDIGGKTGYMSNGARNAARLMTKVGGPVYYYRFSYVAESARTPKTRGAEHASDIPFFFHTESLKFGSATTNKDIGLAKMTSHYLVNFVKTGNPNGGNLPQWSIYESEKDSMMEFTAEGTAVSGGDPWRRDLDTVAKK